MVSVRCRLSPGGRIAARGSAGGDSGSSAIELVILAPMLLVIIWLSIQYALYYQGREVALAAAQLGARVASQDEHAVPGWQEIAQNDAQNYYNGLGTRVLGDSISADAEVSGVGQVRVTVTGQVQSILLGLSLPIHETAGAPIECFRPEADGGQDC
jgi:Flp pilus assembly protein TadG